jgi:hypothetical protein
VGRRGGEEERRRGGEEERRGGEEERRRGGKRKTYCIFWLGDTLHVIASSVNVQVEHFVTFGSIVAL